MNKKVLDCDAFLKSYDNHALKRKRRKRRRRKNLGILKKTTKKRTYPIIATSKESGFRCKESDNLSELWQRARNIGNLMRFQYQIWKR